MWQMVGKTVFPVGVVVAAARNQSGWAGKSSVASPLNFPNRAQIPPHNNSPFMMI
jgi:hypothetical protein